MRVEPRGGIACSPLTITLSRASRGIPSSRTRRPTIASSGPTGYSATSAPSRRIVPVSASGRGSAATAEVTFRKRASGSKVVPWSNVESSTAKKTMSKKRTLSGICSITGKVASTTGTAPRSPAQPMIRRSRAVNFANVVASAEPSGRATTATTSASTVPSTATSPSSDGNTSRPSVKNIVSWAIQARPSWNAVMVRLAGIAVEPSQRPAR
jgi:hypothetical protein